jgi:hypothetical protein
MSRRGRLALAPLVLHLLTACASAGGEADDDLGDDDGATADAAGFIDARPSADGAPPADAAPPPPPPPDAAPPCTGGNAAMLDPSTGHCLVRVDQVVTWTQARTACQSLGGHLVSINAAAENDAVAALVGGAVVWIGANDRDDEDSWAWADTGEPFAFMQWKNGEPNDDGTEDCATLDGGAAGRWGDTECGGDRPYVCEKP